MGKPLPSAGKSQSGKKSAQEEKILSRLQKAELDSMTPLQALNFLGELKKSLKAGSESPKNKKEEFPGLFDE
jgi:hypothetical protein